MALPAAVTPPVAVPDNGNKSGGCYGLSVCITTQPDGSTEESPPYDGKALMEGRDAASEERDANIARGLTEEEKAELGGAGSGTPGGWGPDDEENARNGESQLNKPDVSNISSLSVEEQIGILRDAAKGNKGNFGLGQATAKDANTLGEAWVGPGYRISRDGTSWVSSDGLRVYRPPSSKPNSPHATTGVQANFEQKLTPTGRPISNGHLDIIK
ncbi:hypothetical protein LL364_005123 [Citrobacter freundii]